MWHTLRNRRFIRIWMWDLSDNWTCWMHWNQLLDVLQLQPWLAPLPVTAVWCRTPALLHAHGRIGQACVHHLIFNQIRSWLSCRAVQKGKWGSYAFSHSANEKLQSTHGCHFLSCLPRQIRGTQKKTWLTSPVRFPQRHVQLGPEPIVARLPRVRVSVEKQPRWVQVGPRD